ncbi:MAG TPA: hypothetical protein VFH90_03695 [Candidatus Limnocylindria bacterium]|nr:hypothetical protein [Candidatus Limnocylindria bacterium]
MTLILLCIALALGGCRALIGDQPDNGSNVDGAPANPGDDPIGGGGGGRVDPPPVIGGALREEPDPTVVDARGQSVDHFDIGADGRTLVVYWWGGNTACFGLKEVMVEVQRGTPIITVLEGVRGDHVGMACTAEAVLKSAVVTLDEPIVADAAADAPPGHLELPADGLKVEPVAGVQRSTLHAVSGYRLSADGLTLSAYYVGGTEDCYALAGATAERDDEGLLTISISEGQLPELPVACPDIGVSKFVDFQLDDPLVVVAAFDSGGDAPQDY